MPDRICTHIHTQVHTCTFHTHPGTHTCVCACMHTFHTHTGTCTCTHACMYTHVSHLCRNIHTRVDTSQPCSYMHMCTHIPHACTYTEVRFTPMQEHTCTQISPPYMDMHAHLPIYTHTCMRACTQTFHTHSGKHMDTCMCTHTFHTHAGTCTLAQYTHTRTRAHTRKCEHIAAPAQQSWFICVNASDRKQMGYVCREITKCKHKSRYREAV